MSGTLISSCWVLTAAHCIPQDDWFTSKDPDFWFRVDVGNRGFQTDADNVDKLEQLCGGSEPANEEDKLKCKDLIGHQTLKVKKIITHKKLGKIIYSLEVAHPATGISSRYSA